MVHSLWGRLALVVPVCRWRPIYARFPGTYPARRTVRNVHLPCTDCGMAVPVHLPRRTRLSPPRTLGYAAGIHACYIQRMRVDNPQLPGGREDPGYEICHRRNRLQCASQRLPRSAGRPQTATSLRPFAAVHRSSACRRQGRHGEDAYRSFHCSLWLVPHSCAVMLRKGRQAPCL